jgi:hypothetical protein
MLTEAPPRKRNLKLFLESDRLNTIPLPPEDTLRATADSIQSAMKMGQSVGQPFRLSANARISELKPVTQACENFLKAASDFYQVPRCDVRVLAARPLRVREHSTTELFGDYHPDTMLIRVWMRTAIRKEVTSFGTFLSTLCHEFCHHLDFHRFAFPNSWHTRGFYERTAALYHHAKGTPPKRLVWARVPGQRFRIDWPRTNRQT